MTDVRYEYLDAMGIERYVRRGLSAETPDPTPAESDRDGIETAAATAGAGWEALKARVAACEACALSTTRTQAVFGVGNPSADWMIVGEAPGAEEDRRGEPFVGRAGKLLDEMLLAIGLRRADVFIANMVKCRPPDNRDPKADELDACRAYLEQQIEHVGPRLILAVGRIAAQALLDSTAPVGRLRGRVHRLGSADVPVVVTYHPAYLLRSPSQKAKSWQDLRLALDTMAAS